MNTFFSYKQLFSSQWKQVVNWYSSIKIIQKLFKLHCFLLLTCYVIYEWSPTVRFCKTVISCLYLHCIIWWYHTAVHSTFHTLQILWWNRLNALKHVYVSVLIDPRLRVTEIYYFPQKWNLLIIWWLKF